MGILASMGGPEQPDLWLVLKSTAELFPELIDQGTSVPGDNFLITLVVGGVRSGKSRYAQELAMAQDKVAFIATAKPCDDEMRAKIERHKADRPAGWTTIEAGAEAEA